MTNSLTESTRVLVKARAAEITFQKLAVELDVSIDWLSKFANDRIHSPSADRVQFIYEKLSGKRLFEQ